MFNDAKGFHKIYLATGRTDLRRGIDGLATIVKHHFNLDPFEKNTLFLFCGRRMDRLKGLVWEGTDFCSYIKGLKLAASVGPQLPKKLWRLHKNNINF